MRIVSLFSLILIIAGLQNASAQDCPFYFPPETGTELVLTTYSRPGKVKSSVKQVTAGKKVIDGKTRLDVISESFDAKGKSVAKGNFEVWCDGGHFYLDMRSMLSSMNMSEMGEAKIEATNMEFPASPTPGQKLKDASITMTTQGPIPFNMRIEVTDRKVEAVEKITTPAGTFDCVKITCACSSKMLIRTETKMTDWYAPNVGVVRSETYHQGKLLSFSELTSLKK
jgi:hypothetical protein